MSNVKVGDKVKITGPSGLGYTGWVGKIATVEIVFHGCIHAVREEDNFGTRSFGTDSYELIPDTPDNTFKPGDKVVVLASLSAGGSGSTWQGRVGVIKEHDHHDVYKVEITNNEGKIVRGWNTYHARDLKLVSKATELPDYQVGDKVRIIAGAIGVGQETEHLVGTVQTISKVEKHWVGLEGSKFCWNKTACIRPATWTIGVVFDSGKKVYTYRVTENQHGNIELGDKVLVESPVSGKTWCTVVAVHDNAQDTDAAIHYKSILKYKKATFGLRYTDDLGALTIATSCGTPSEEWSKSLFDDFYGAKERGSMLHAAFEYNLIKPINHEDTAMRINPIKLTQKTFISGGDYSGQDVSQLTQDQLFEAIAQSEAEIKRLNAIEHKPKALEQRIVDLQAGIDALVALSDAREA